MRRNLRDLIAFLVVLAVVGVGQCMPAHAACVNCPNPPCEIQECPPDEAGIFSVMLIDGVETGIGQTVEIEEGYTISVSSVDANTFDFGIELTVERESIGMDAITLVLDEYVLNGSTWEFEGSTDPVTLVSTNGGISQGQCANMFEGYCHTERPTGAYPHFNYCAVGDTCSRSKWCDDIWMGPYCLVMYSTCTTVGNDCTCSIEGAIPCLDFMDPTPLPSVRRAVCLPGKKCQARIVTVSEG